jgi:hypothetical protein
MKENKIKRIFTFIISQQPVAFLTILIIRLSNLISNEEFWVLLLFFSIIPSFSLFTFLKYPWDFQKERHISFLVNWLSFLPGLILVYLLHFGKISLFIALAYNITGIVLSVANALGYKASGHAASIAGPSTMLTILFGLKGSLMYLLLLPASYLKISLKDHTVMQFVTGAFIAIVSTILAYYLVGGV